MSSPKNFSPRSKKPLPLSFYRRPTVIVARDLLGKGLVVGDMACEITEVEAYLGVNDDACHASRGMTKRNETMFEAGGVCYVYFIYGMYFCMNVVTEEAGVGSAVLLRSARPLAGIEKMRRNRGNKALKDFQLLNGPGKLCLALGVDKRLNGRRFTEASLKIVDLGQKFSEHQVTASPRIGISQEKEALLRFCLKGSEHLSRKG